MGEDTRMSSNSNNCTIVERHDKFCVIGPERFCLSITHVNDLHSICEFEVRDSDTIVAAFPYSGSQLIAEMVWLLKNNFDYAGTKKHTFVERNPCFESLTLIKPHAGVEFPEAYDDSLSYAAKLNDPRCMMTHLPFSLIPPDISAKFKHPKLIHVYRHPAEICREYYDYFKKATNTTTTFATYAKEFMGGTVLMGPFWKHVLGYWEARNEQDILFVKCEDIITNLPSVINSVAKFIDVNVSDEQLPDLLAHLTGFKETISALCQHTPDTSAGGSRNAVLTKPLNNWFDLWCRVKTDKTEFDWKRKL